MSTGQLGFYHPGFPYKGDEVLAFDAMLAGGPIMLGSWFPGDSPTGNGSFSSAVDWLEKYPGRRAQIAAEPIKARRLVDGKRITDAQRIDQLRRGAAGEFDNWFRTFAKSLDGPLAKSLWRPFREGSGAWYDWAWGLAPDLFIRLWNRGYDIVKGIRPDVEVVFNWASTGGQLRTKTMGTKLLSTVAPPLCKCDRVAIDNYRGDRDFAKGTKAELDRLVDISKANDVDMAVCEFGVYVDDPGYISSMHGWTYSTPRVREVVYQDGGDSRLSIRPESAKRFGELTWNRLAA